MISKIYQFKLTSINEAKIAATYVTEELSSSISDYELAGLSVVISKDGVLSVTLKFDDLEELKRFEIDKADLVTQIRDSFLCRVSSFNGVTVYNYEREASATQYS
jgi:hypothetical protein